MNDSSHIQEDWTRRIEMDGFGEVRRFTVPRVCAVSAVAATILDCDQPRILADFDTDGAVIVGVARWKHDTIRGLWERHDGGDAILVLVAGQLTATFHEAHADRVLQAGAGDVILIPRGIPHCFEIRTDEVSLLFLTPRSGNSRWSEDAQIVSRHP
ncbi:cupin domain-containing protein [Dongia sedimenti]|uniref:Cupin domain-containing protein n=1 Tax=Dongia sedimenti TaxID=3064282 RepID=A0ABU0YHP4_9PROT|nr:cupin domain-containing protein [Rhodospirillaceae bacterium R-7]